MNTAEQIADYLANSDQWLADGYLEVSIWYRIQSRKLMEAKS